MKKYTLIVLFLAAVVLLGQQRPLLAHGGGTLQITNAPVGECLISVWSAPPQAKANTPLHITVGAAQAADGEPVLDAEMWVQVLSESSEEPIAAQAATTEQSVNRLFYEADLPELAVGTYQIEVSTRCRGTEGAVSFLVTVRPSVNPLYIAVPLGLGGLLVAVLLFRGWHKRETAVVPKRKRKPVR